MENSKNGEFYSGKLHSHIYHLLAIRAKINTVNALIFIMDRKKAARFETRSIKVYLANCCIFAG